MSYTLTDTTRKLAKLTGRIRGVCGGTSAGKTISILMILITKAHRDKVPTLTSVVSESFPHLKRGAIRDFKNIMQGRNYWDDKRWNATDSVYTFETGSRIEFFSADQPSKVRGPRRDRLFINECNNVSYESFDQLAVRTRLEIWLDWNPTFEFWFYTELLGRRDDVEMITVTYKDNSGLPESIVRDIEAHKPNKAWWRVYGEGKLGEVEGRIYTGWQIVDSIPHEARLEGYGLDFGYSNDPAAVVAVYYHNGGYIIDEVLYRKGMSNSEIANFMRNQEYGVIVADSAEPKSIDEIGSYGLSIVPAQKGSDSVRQGIDYVQSQKISVTKRSTNMIKEYRSYLWKTDREGKTINKPEGGNDHAMDALRYKLSSVIKPKYAQEPTVQTSGDLEVLWS